MRFRGDLSKIGRFRHTKIWSDTHDHIYRKDGCTCAFCKPVLAQTRSSKTRARSGPALAIKPWSEAQICPCKFCRPVYQIGDSAVRQLRHDSIFGPVLTYFPALCDPTRAV